MLCQPNRHYIVSHQHDKHWHEHNHLEINISSLCCTFLRSGGNTV